MAEFKTIMREYDRMCYRTCCSDCPIALISNSTNLSCNDFMRKFPEKAEHIIIQWASEHPIVTNRRKFEEVFGFNIAAIFEVNERSSEWLDEEYKEK